MKEVHFLIIFVCLALILLGGVVTSQLLLFNYVHTLDTRPIHVTVEVPQVTPTVTISPLLHSVPTK